MPLPGLDGGEPTLPLLAGPIGDALPLAVGADRLQAGVSAGEHREVGPVGRGVERAQPQQLCHRELGLDVGVWRNADELDEAVPDRIELGPATAGRWALRA